MTQFWRVRRHDTRDVPAGRSSSSGSRREMLASWRAGRLRLGDGRAIAIGPTTQFADGLVTRPPGARRGGRDSSWRHRQRRFSSSSRDTDVRPTGQSSLASAAPSGGGSDDNPGAPCEARQSSDRLGRPCTTGFRQLESLDRDPTVSPPEGTGGSSPALEPRASGGDDRAARAGRRVSTHHGGERDHVAVSSPGALVVDQVGMVRARGSELVAVTVGARGRAVERLPR